MKPACGIATLIFCTLLVGCGGGGSTKPVAEITSDVELRILRVIGGSEDVGDQFNEGNRMTDAEITDIVEKAVIARSKVYGPNTNFTWDGNIINLRANPSFMTRGDGTALPVDNFYQFIATGPVGGPDPTKLSIYFAGCYVTPFGTNFNAVTQNPSRAGGNGISPPGYILVLDQELPTDFGGVETQNRIDKITLIHEVGHYLGRWTSPDMVGQNTYFAGHPTMPVPAGHVMRADAASTDFDDTIVCPGDHFIDGVQCDLELGEASRRVDDAAWNSVNPRRYQCP